MARRIVAKTGEYTNQQGEKKNEWTKIGVIMSNDNGDYVMLDPTVNLSGVLQKQNMLAAQKLKNGENAKIGSSVMCSVFDDSNQAGQSSPQQNTGGGAMGGNFDDVPFASYGSEFY